MLWDNHANWLTELGCTIGYSTSHKYFENLLSFALSKSRENMIYDVLEASFILQIHLGLEIVAALKRHNFIRSDDNKSSPAQWLSEVKKAEATVTVTWNQAVLVYG